MPSTKELQHRKRAEEEGKVPSNLALEDTRQDGRVAKEDTKGAGAKASKLIFKGKTYFPMIRHDTIHQIRLRSEARAGRAIDI
jgi:hypothetical protein